MFVPTPNNNDGEPHANGGDWTSSNSDGRSMPARNDGYRYTSQEVKDLIARAKTVPIKDVLDRLGIGINHLRRRGRQLAGPCPKCGGEKTSKRFWVDPGTNLFGCHDCHDPGSDVIGLVRWYEGLEFIPACEWITRQERPKVKGNAETKPKAKTAPNGAHQRNGKTYEKLDCKSETVKTFPYVDENGEPLFYVDRVEYRQPDGERLIGHDGKWVKDFFPRRPERDLDGTTVWVRGLAGGDYMRRAPGQDWIRFDEERWAKYPAKTRQRKPFPAAKLALYRLPELLAAWEADPDAGAVIVEGEGKVDAWRNLGYVATCNVGGAEKWKPEYSAYFRDKNVLISPDNDDKGRKHAEKVAQSLHGIAKCIRVLEIPGLPPKGDIVDWEKSGRPSEDLEALVENAPEWPASSSVGEAGDLKPKAVIQSDTFPKLDSAAYHGLAGEIVHTIEPHTEADPAAILVQLLAYFGNIIGRSAHYPVEADKHRGNLFVVLVGATSRGRKGTSAGRVRSVVASADEQWTGDRIKSGLSSGEGLISQVRDQVEKWNPKEKSFEIVDPGIADKRLLVEAPEFAGALAVMERHGNTLSMVLRDGWDGKDLETLVKNSPLKATGPHISVVGHITEAELRARLTRTDAANGFGNRFLFVCVKRSRLLPFGGNLAADKIHDLSQRFARVVEHAKKVGLVTMTAAARSEWEKIYEELSADQPGLLGAVTARSEAQAIRLALLYALLDGKGEIDAPHLKAALALVDYAEDSAARIFGDALGDPVADEILAALRRAGSTGLSRTDIRDLFGRNQSAERIGIALALLLKHSRARFEERRGGAAGRSAEVWFAV
jgi:Protein of unknown function (DUF3987)